MGTTKLTQAWTLRLQNEQRNRALFLLESVVDLIKKKRHTAAQRKYNVKGNKYQLGTRYFHYF